MADYFSSLMTGVHPTGLITTVDSQYRPPVNEGHARTRRAVSKFAPGIALTIGDTVRLKQFKSGDVPHEILLTSADSGTTGLMDFGLYKTGGAHDGAVIEVDTFGASQDVKTIAWSKLDILGSNKGDKYDAGQPFWKWVDAGATYTEDPHEDWDFVMTVVEVNSSTAWEIRLDFVYASGD